MKWRFVILINVMTCGAVIAAFSGIYFYMKAHPRLTAESRAVPVITDTGKSFFRYDDRLGFANVSAAQGTHHAHQLQVRYSIDDTGHRITPDPVNPKGRVVVLGCSFTFGDGVNDEENFSYILGRDYWREYKIVNGACMAYGTAQAYLQTEDEMGRPNPAALVIYCYISAHIQRNYLDQAWLNLLVGKADDPSSRRGNPHFEIEQGQLVYKGIADPSEGLPAGAALTGKSVEMTIKLITEMNALCAHRNVPFVLCVLPTKETDPQDSQVLPTVVRAGVPVVDLRGICEEADFIPNDGHPAFACHEKLAQAIATSDVLQRCWPPARIQSR